MDDRFIHRLAGLVHRSIAFIGSDWRPDETAMDSLLPGYKYHGIKPAINCNDVFFWGSADAEDLSPETLGDLDAAIADCHGDEESGALLYCARRRGMRPQGAMYKYIPKNLWAFFDACGPYRETDFFNPMEHPDAPSSPPPAE